MKSSNIKTKLSFDEIKDLVSTKLNGTMESVKQLIEGHISQAYYFEDSAGSKFVLRISRLKDGFEKDQYANLNFNSADIPIPEVTGIGKLSENSYYCVSRYVDGTASDKLSEQQMLETLPAQLNCFSKIYGFDISKSLGWGSIDVDTGNGKYDTWEQFVVSHVNKLDEKQIKNGLKTMGLKQNIFDEFVSVFRTNLKQLGMPARRLIHGDLGFDNVLIKNSSVTAIIDWASVSYGDWVFEYSGFDFWWKGRYPPVREFGEKYNLDCEKLDERIKCSTAKSALTTVEFAIMKESDETISWLKQHLNEILERIKN